MLYDILDINIPTVDMLQKPEPSLFQPTGITNVRSTYDSIDAFGTHAEDYENALWEICRILEIATDRDYFEKDILFGTLLECNVRSFFKCVNAKGIIGRNVSEDIQFVISSLCYYGRYEWIAEVIHRYFLDYETAVKAGKTMIPMSFIDLYVIIGDICLFNYHNSYVAGRFYSLAAFNWNLDAAIKESVQFDWDDKSFCLTMLATRIANLRPGTLQSKLLIDSRYLDDRREFTSDFLKIVTTSYEMNEWRFGVRTDAELEILDNLLLIYNRISSRGLQLDQYGTEFRVATSMVLRCRWLFFLDCFARLNNESDSIKQKYKTYVLKALIEDTKYSPIVYVQDYVSERILSFNKWYRIFDFDLSGNNEEYKTVLRLSAFSFEVHKCLALLRINGPHRLAYYTRFDSLRHMFWEKENNDDKLSHEEEVRKYGHLSLFHVAYMNDPNEGKILSKYLLGNSQLKDEDREDLRQPYVFIKCFTSLIDDLPMWEMYGDSAKGVCIILNGDFYGVNFVPHDDYPELLRAQVYKTDIPLYHVCYMKKQKNQFGYSINHSDNPNISGNKLNELNSHLKSMRKLIEKDKQEWYVKCLDKMLYLFKDSDYYHEQETSTV